MKKGMIFKTFVVAFFAFVASLSNVNAQSAEVTDEELEKYAIMEDSIDAMKKNVNVVINNMIKENENITGQRYLDLSSADSTKLKSLNATEEEIAFVQEVQATKDSLVQEINTTFQSLAKDYLGEGGRVYKKVKTAIQSDADVKARYEAKLDEVKAKSEEGSKATDDAEGSSKL